MRQIRNGRDKQTERGKEKDRQGDRKEKEKQAADRPYIERTETYKFLHNLHVYKHTGRKR